MPTLIQLHRFDKKPVDWTPYCSRTVTDFNTLVFCSLSVQIAREENKDEVIRRLAEMCTKAQLEDKQYMENLVRTVNNSDLNVTTKVSRL